WNASVHAPHDNDPETDGGMNTYCASCKSPSQWDPTAERSTGVDIPKAEYRGITCGDCHNTHNVTGHVGQLKWDPEESCDVCHNGGHHETMRTEELGGTPSVDREDYPYMEEVSCVECHMFTTGRSVPEPWKVIGHSFEPTIEACISCHTDVYDSLPDVTYNETNMAEWDAWEVTLDEALEEWEGVVNASQLRHDELLEEVNLLVEEVEEIMEVAEDNGTWTTEMEEAWEQAEYDWELADHASRGAHNPAYATALLTAAKEGFEEIIEELSVGTLEGKVTDESDTAMAGVYISVNGLGTTTEPDGTYSLELEPGTYTVTAFKKGSIDQSATGVVIIHAAVIEKNFTLADDFDNDGTADSTDTDDDNDGMPDEWETNNGLNSKDPTDASTDDDNDGMTNLQEYKEGKDPQVADKAEAEEADTILYLALIMVLIIVIVLLGMMLAKKGGGKPALPPEEPQEEPPVEEEEELEEGE
ncbi:MAG: carboxypeptidase regulatory-like domain-containing protein, partial [Thermoplasmata archaeon]